jgi:hypothetical protein
MKKYSLSSNAALEKLREVHPGADPNNGFLEQLGRYGTDIGTN